LKSFSGENELHWTAACYVLGELSAEEMTRFEARLLEDHAAREAVAESVILLQAAVRPKPTVVSVRRKRITTFLAAVVAICVLVGVGVFLVPNSTESADAGRAQKNVVRAAANDEWILDLPELLEVQAGVEDADAADSLVPVVVEETDADIPSWLILATSKEGTS